MYGPSIGSNNGNIAGLYIGLTPPLFFGASGDIILKLKVEKWDRYTGLP
jgi:hypothetical protein